MSCLKCTCGCDGLTKEALAEIIKATDRVTEFINNQTAQDMFERLIYSDEPDTYQPHASGSRKPAKPNAIKYLEHIKEAQRLLATNQASEDDRSFAENIAPDLANDLLDCVDRCEDLANRKDQDDLADRADSADHADCLARAARAKVLQEIITEYGNRLSETSQYKRFQKTLCDAYKKK